MTWWLALSGGVGLLLVLLLLGVPIFVAFLILNVAGILVLFGPSGFGMFANSIYATGTINAGASLDPIIPPSVLAILIATIAQISTGRLLIAGIIPGLLLTVMFLVYVLIRVKLKPSLAPDVALDVEGRDTSTSAVVALLKMMPSALIFFLVMGLVMLGIATPTEIGRAACR